MTAPILAILLAPLAVVVALILGAAALLGALAAALLAVHGLLEGLGAAAQAVRRLAEDGLGGAPVAGPDADPDAG